MDGFDDLLSPSRQILEDNPFADPFAKRSGSPDPWASPFVNTIPAEDYSQSATSTVDTYSTTVGTYQSTSSPTTASATTPTSSDPLESVIYDVGDEKYQRSASPSPGFRESIEPTVSTTDSEPREQSTPHTDHLPVPVAKAETPRANTPSSPTSSQSQQVKPSTRLSRVLSPSPSTSKSSTEFLSPLERRSTPIAINQSIAGLSLGGESLGGWQSEQGAWGGQTEDDSDDDKPISQTVTWLHEHGGNKIVSRDVDTKCGFSSH